jgi:hypothetical protein
MNRHGWLLLALPVQRATSAIASSWSAIDGFIGELADLARPAERSEGVGGVVLTAAILLRVNRSVDGVSTTLPARSRPDVRCPTGRSGHAGRMNVIEVSNLTKRSGDRVRRSTASRSAVEQGEILAYPRPEWRRQDHAPWNPSAASGTPDSRLDQRPRVSTPARPATAELREVPRRPAPGERAAGRSSTSGRRSSLYAAFYRTPARHRDLA